MLENKEKVDKCIIISSILGSITGFSFGYENRTLNELQDSLEITLSNNTYFILSKVGFSTGLVYQFLGLDDSIDSTKFWRERGLPQEYVLLALDDASAVLMITQDDSEKESPVIECDYHDFMNICDGDPTTSPITKYPSFVDFFEHLLESEMERIKEDIEEIEDPEKRKEVEKMLAKAEKMLSK